MSGCPLCRGEGETLLWRDGLCRVILAREPGYPGFCRAVWADHVAEMTDLSPEDRHHLMTVVFGAETALRRALAPVKVNLASLGNQVPHLHWHVIPRFEDDPHYPGSVWGEARRPGGSHGRPEPSSLQETLADLLKKELG